MKKGICCCQHLLISPFPQNIFGEGNQIEFLVMESTLRLGLICVTLVVKEGSFHSFQHHGQSTKDLGTDWVFQFPYLQSVQEWILKALPRTTSFTHVSSFPQKLY